VANKAEKQLLEFFSGMDEPRQTALLEYAAFLYERSDCKPEPVAEPEFIPRPNDETVIAAIKRLSETYPMLDKQYLMHEISGLMAQHMLQGRAACDVIDDIEKVFESSYQALLKKQG